MAPGRGLPRPRTFGVSTKGVPCSSCDPISSSPPGVAMDANGETPPSERRRCDRCPAAAEGGGGGGGGIRDDGGGSGSGGMCESMPISDASSCDRGRLAISPLRSTVSTTCNTDGIAAVASERRQPRLSRLDEGHVDVDVDAGFPRLR